MIIHGSECTGMGVGNYKIKKKEFIIIICLFVMFIASMLFTGHNYRFYKQTIARVINAEITGQKKVIDRYRNQDMIYTQRLTLQVENGRYEGHEIRVENEYSQSGVYDDGYQAGDSVFINLNDSKGQYLTGIITGLKRDRYIVLTAWIFIILIIIIGKRKGFYSVVSLTLNIILFSLAMDLYLKGLNLLLVCGFIVIIFTVFSLVIVSGRNEKTLAAIIATVTGTFLSLLIAFLVLWVTGEKGLRYEEMQFLTRPPHEIFMAEILVGALGAIMDISITMSSSLYEVYQNNTSVTTKALIVSGTQIGKDIMGTMINVLFFAYVSGAIPMILVYLRNGSTVFYTFSMNLSLELVRALTGSIGIIITIPISLYSTVFFIDRRRSLP